MTDEIERLQASGRMDTVLDYLCLGLSAAYDQALLDAAVQGAGFIMLTNESTGLEAHWLDPEHVLIKHSEK